MPKFRIEGGHALSGAVTPSGNKNEALPALLACLLTDQTVTLKNMPRIGDVETICQILHEIGVEVEWQGSSVTLNAGKLSTHKLPHDLCQKVRASILFLGPLLSRIGKIELPLPGGDVIGARRIDTHWEGLEALGAKLELGKTINGSLKKIQPCDIYLDEPSVTATENLLLASAISSGQTILHNAACEPHVKGLCHLLNAMGAKITGIGSNRLVIDGVSQLNGCEHEIGVDFMEAGSFLCLGAISNGTVTVKNLCLDDYRFILKTFKRLGFHLEVGKNQVTVDGTRKNEIHTDIGGKIPTIYSGPWPAFPTDLMSVAIVAATQSHGTTIFFEKMFEGRMFFTDMLMSMGANIVLCDPHRIVVNGPKQLIAERVSSPDVRAGMALVMAACIAKGTTDVENITQIERGYTGIEVKLQSLGAKITKMD